MALHLIPTRHVQVQVPVLASILRWSGPAQWLLFPSAIIQQTFLLQSIIPLLSLLSELHVMTRLTTNRELHSTSSATSRLTRVGRTSNNRFVCSCSICATSRTSSISGPRRPNSTTSALLSRRSSCAPVALAIPLLHAT